MRLILSAALVAILPTCQLLAAPPAKVDTIPSSVVPPKPPPPNEPPPADGGPIKFVYSTDQAIALFKKQIAANPKDAHAHRHLGEFLERKANETGDESLFEPAEEHLRKALDLYPGYTRAQTSLAAVLCSRHRFKEGLKLVEEVTKANPKDVDALAIQGDALLELGQYEQAEAVYQRLMQVTPIPEILARVANLAELRGQTGQARDLMQRAVQLVQKVGGSDAWYRGRLGDIALESGNRAQALEHYRQVPAGVDALHDATAAMGRIAVAEGKYEEATEFYKKAVDIGPDAAMLSYLGDLHVRAGKPELAKPLFDQLVKQCHGFYEHRRALSQFYSDHDRNLPEALELARLDYADRQDIYGADALSWALYRNGKFEEAAKMSSEAMRLGTQDAKLYFHAGMIQAALKNSDKAREFLSHALKLNAGFSVTGADAARATLSSLEK